MCEDGRLNFIRASRSETVVDNMISSLYNILNIYELERQNIMSAIENIEAYIEEEFQWFHRHPELSYKEVETTKRIRASL